MTKGENFEDEFAKFQQQIKAATEKLNSRIPTQSNPTSNEPSAISNDRSSQPSTKNHVITSANISVQSKFEQNRSSVDTQKPETKPNGQWKWDGTTWRWRTDLKPKTTIRPLLTRPSVLTPSKQPQMSFQPVLPTTSPGSFTPAVGQLTPGSEGGSSSKKTTKRTAAGEVWVDSTLSEWPEDDHRIFVGDLAPDATDTILSEAFSKYPSFNMARVVIDKRTGLCRGYGFVSFARGEDMVAALSKMNGKYVGGRPVKLKRSNWRKRTLDAEKRRELHAFRSISKR